jgi:predicted dehydrogenase
VVLQIEDRVTAIEGTPTAAVQGERTAWRGVVPEVDYQPSRPTDPSIGIGLIGCGGITAHHLTAYRRQGWNVVALCDRRMELAQARRDAFYPDAWVTSDYRALLARPEVAVVDVATYPIDRVPIIADALRAGKHVLSQKPFVLDLDVGQSLVQLARQQDRVLAVNQNARFAPHYRFIHQWIGRGELGASISTHLSVQWDHGWVKGTPFESVDDLILYDFAIHWFDLVRYFLPQPIQRVTATKARSPGQSVRPPLLAQCLIELEDAQASLVFDGSVPFGQRDQTVVCGTLGTIRSEGPSNQQQSITIEDGRGTVHQDLQGTWFPDAFAGTMGELLCSIEQRRPSVLDASDNLESLAVCFAAIQSARIGKAVAPWSVRTLPGSVDA